MKHRNMDLPAFFTPGNASIWTYRPNHTAVMRSALDAKQRFGILPSGTDKFRIAVLGIDLQKDFCFKPSSDGMGGTLFVAGRSGTGAIDDNIRIAEFLYRNAGVITDFYVTLDTHFPHQCFFTPFWETMDGEPLDEHTLIALNDGKLVNLALDGTVIHGSVRPNPAIANWVSGNNYGWLVKQMEHYCTELQKGGKYTLYLWPFHCMLGDAGHALAGVIEEARFYHSVLRGSRGFAEVKGGNPLTENYSVFRPEVLTRWDGKPLAQKNTGFLNLLINYDAVIIVGQAGSHCVKASTDDVREELAVQDASLAKKIYVVEDCMSAVTVPDGQGGFAADFTKDAEEALERYRNAGMNVVKSTDPLETWPGLSRFAA